MSVWFEKSRPALLEALGNVCKQIDEHFLDGTPCLSDLLPEDISTNRHRVKDAQQPSHHLEDDLTTSRISSLTYSSWERIVEENRKLRNELKSLRKDTHQGLDRATQTEDLSQQFSGPSTCNLGDSTASSLTKDWKVEYGKVVLRYNALAQNFKIAKAALEKRKDERDKWISYADELAQCVQKAEASHQISILGTSIQERPSISKTPQSIGGNDSTTEIANIQQLMTVPAPASEARPHEVLGLFGAGKMRTEEGEADLQLPRLKPMDSKPGPAQVKQEPSSDGPVVVSERVVKKRKQETKEHTPRRRRIKTETESDPTSATCTMQINSSQQESSVDLGNVQNQIITPRKRRVAGKIYVRPDLDTMEISFADPPAPPISPRTRKVDQIAPVLNPLCVNERSIQKVFDIGGKSKAKPHDAKLKHGVAMLAEDGQRRQQATPSKMLAETPIPQTRLSALLNEPSVGDESPLMRVGIGRRREPEPARATPSFLSSRELPFGEKLRPKGRTAERDVVGILSARDNGIKSSIKATSEARPYKKPATPVLRNKPVDELRLSDFKVNPQANNGYDFAYSEVVRDRDERACLPGCTDMHCCGKDFRALAESMKPDPPLTPRQRQEEQKLLEDHLGEHCYRLASMSKEERNRLWLDAKTNELAQKYGKHRHRFSRMRSPPGFWNADFPSTQELEADRVEAARREKSAVQERYREAMKTKGRWMFRDE